ncbi:protoplasts-secreted, partial [Massospora cicadina]
HCNKKFDIKTLEELKQLSKCSTVANVNIDVSEPIIDLGSLKRVTGDLSISGRNAVDIDLGELVEVGGIFSIKDSLGVEGVNLSKLTSVGELAIINSGSNLILDLKAGLIKADKVTIRRTRIKTLRGMNPSKLWYLDISGNAELEAVSFPNLRTINGDLIFEANPIATVALPELTSVDGKLTLTGSKCGDIPKLKSLKGPLSLDNTQFETISFKELLYVGQWLSIVQNKKLSNITFGSLLDIIGGLNIQDNGNVKEIHLPNLRFSDGLTINENSLTHIELNNKFVSFGAADVTANIDCEKFIKETASSFPNVACKSTASFKPNDTDANPTEPNGPQTKPGCDGNETLSCSDAIFFKANLSLLAMTIFLIVSFI